MNSTTEKFLKKVITYYLENNAYYKKVFKVLLSEEREKLGDNVYTSLNRFHRGKQADNIFYVSLSGFHRGKQPPKLSSEMKYQSVFDKLEKYGIIKKEGQYNYIVDKECRLYIEGKLVFPDVKKKTRINLSDDEKKEIKMNIFEEMKSSQFDRLRDGHSQNEFSKLHGCLTECVIDLYEKKIPISEIWEKHKEKLHNWYSEPKKTTSTNIVNRTFRMHMKILKKAMPDKKH